jgi:hypothetical protein
VITEGAVAAIGWSLGRIVYTRCWVAVLSATNRLAANDDFARVAGSAPPYRPESDDDDLGSGDQCSGQIQGANSPLLTFSLQGQDSKLGADVDEPERSRHAGGRRGVVTRTIAVVRRIAPSATVITSPIVVIVSPAAILRPGHPGARRRRRSGVRDSRADSQRSRPECANNRRTRCELLHCIHINQPQN